MKKTYKLNFDALVIIPDHQTLPMCLETCCC